MVGFGREQLARAICGGGDGGLVGDVELDEGEAGSNVLGVGDGREEGGFRVRWIGGTGRGEDGEGGGAEEVPGESVAYASA